MEFKYSSHAVSRMIERKISTQEVELVVNDPDGKIKQSKDKYICYKKLKNRKDNLIAVVAVIKNRVFFEIITVMVNFEVKK